MSEAPRRLHSSLASHADLAETDPAAANVFSLELTLGLLYFFFVLEEHQCIPSVLAVFLLNDDVLFSHVESAEELDNFLDSGSPS